MKIIQVTVRSLRGGDYQSESVELTAEVNETTGVQSVVKTLQDTAGTLAQQRLDEVLGLGKKVAEPQVQVKPSIELPDEVL